MKLLFDENVSPKLVGLVDAEFPESAHIYDLGLRGATDGRIWEHARENGFTIVSRTTTSGNGASFTVRHPRLSGSKLVTRQQTRSSDC